jgi:hypothetical protein
MGAKSLAVAHSSNPADLRRSYASASGLPVIQEQSRKLGLPLQQLFQNRDEQLFMPGVRLIISMQSSGRERSV